MARPPFPLPHGPRPVLPGPLAPQRVLRVPPRPRALAKWRELERQAAADAIDPVIVQFASRLARPFSPDDWLAIAREIFRWVRDGIRYQHDPDRREEFAPAMEVLQRGWDDCDGKVKLAVALMRALGMDAEVVPVFAGGELGHVQMRVRFPGSRRVAGNVDGWIYGEMTIRGAELTQNPHAVASNPDTGKLPLSGGPVPVYMRSVLE